MKKLISILLVLTMLFALAACTNEDDSKKNEETPNAEETSVEEADSEVGTTDDNDSDVSETEEEPTESVSEDADMEGESSDESSTDVIVSDFKDMVMITGDNDIEVMLSQVNYMVYQIKNYYETNYGETVWDQVTDDNQTVDEMILQEIKNIIIRMEVSEVIAKEQGFELTAEQVVQASEQGKSLFTSYPMEVAMQLGITEELVIDVLLKEAIANEIYAQMMAEITYDEAELDEIVSEDVQYQNIMEIGVENYGAEVRARHILISTLDELGQPLEGDALDEALKTIEDLRQRALDGEDFAALATEYTDDPGSKETGGEYTFGRGQMVPEFEAAAYSLEIGGISEVVKTSYGYHILKLEETFPATEEAIASAEATIESIRNSYAGELKYNQYADEFDALIESYNVIYAEEWASVSMKNKMIN